MKESPKRTAAFRRCIAFTLSSLFLLFLSVSQPHRVHHLFEAHGHSHDETQVDSENHDHGQDQTKPAQTDCVVQSVAQNCHLGQAELVELPFVESHLQSFHPRTSQWVDLFTAFPFLQRAPPKDTLFS
jgi:cytochrome P450